MLFYSHIHINFFTYAKGRKLSDGFFFSLHHNSNPYLNAYGNCWKWPVFRTAFSILLAMLLDLFLSSANSTTDREDAVTSPYKNTFKVVRFGCKSQYVEEKTVTWQRSALPRALVKQLFTTIWIFSLGTQVWRTSCRLVGPSVYSIVGGSCRRAVSLIGQVVCQSSLFTSKAVEFPRLQHNLMAWQPGACSIQWEFMNRPSHAPCL